MNSYMYIEDGIQSYVSHSQYQFGTVFRTTMWEKSK